MTIGEAWLERVRRLEPGCFALVMATGIVSIDAGQHALPRLARALFAFNLAAYAWLLALTVLRLARFRREVVADFTDPSRGAGFLTLAAATCVLGSQCVMVAALPALAAGLAVAGAALWLALIYLFFAATITARFKPGFTRSINGGWLVAVVATQALSALLTLVAASRADPDRLQFVALCLYMLGAALYLLIITLVVYRMVFFPLRAREFTPPYWIDMGALAVTTLAGSLIVLHAPAGGTLAELLPFVKGFTLFFWATASWWIPLLVILELWRHVWRHVPLRYETDDWDIVFPIGMYTVGTFELAHALHADFLLAIPAAGVYASLAAWLLVALIGLRRLYRKGLRHGTHPSH
ncbi:tellurite resistance/C4-dicarboxylate transporter family protein [Fulvimonas sp. R45]|uniref:tellurite resistance/C4-dicarboxylate transporter family protein n=1 Tax=Fulvimonas sp. R45 TaxID=3045937 RepID=UPI00265D6618|nr:tellurite resistance/C4-dicarboxylate transporter family protein [Fulvimonas sp. R45]MDO1528092.1 tellurite resistance/C4-dicarboxylate transporter family protein [Fulvimonas sp. R45]